MSECSKCRAEIEWVKTKANKWTPVNPDGEPHWASCPDADWFRHPSYSKKGQRPT